MAPGPERSERSQNYRNDPRKAGHQYLGAAPTRFGLGRGGFFEQVHGQQYAQDPVQVCHIEEDLAAVWHTDHGAGAHDARRQRQTRKSHACDHQRRNKTRTPDVGRRHIGPRQRGARPRDRPRHRMQIAGVGRQPGAPSAGFGRDEKFHPVLRPKLRGEPLIRPTTDERHQGQHCHGADGDAAPGERRRRGDFSAGRFHGLSRRQCAG